MSRATNSIALGLTVLLALALPLRAEQNRRCDQATGAEPQSKSRADSKPARQDLGEARTRLDYSL